MGHWENPLRIVELLGALGGIRQAGNPYEHGDGITSREKKQKFRGTLRTVAFEFITALESLGDFALSFIAVL